MNGLNWVKDLCMDCLEGREIAVGGVVITLLRWIHTSLLDLTWDKDRFGEVTFLLVPQRRHWRSLAMANSDEAMTKWSFHAIAEQWTNLRDEV
jgi:hypothetical protein